jgi:hypothetical protein
MMQFTATVTLAAGLPAYVVGPGEVDIHVTEDRYLFVYDYSQRKKDGENSGLNMVFAPGSWSVVNIRAHENNIVGNIVGGPA